MPVPNPKRLNDRLRKITVVMTSVEPKSHSILVSLRDRIAAKYTMAQRRKLIRGIACFVAIDGAFIVGMGIRMWHIAQAHNARWITILAEVGGDLAIMSGFCVFVLSAWFFRLTHSQENFNALEKLPLQNR